MNFTDIFIRRPVLATVVSLMILVLGLRAMGSLPVLQYPRTENAVVTVSTTYYGADPDVIAGFITTPLENAIAQANGIDYMTSTSQSGVSTITVNLRLNYDADKALTEINTKVNSVLNQLAHRRAAADPDDQDRRRPSTPCIWALAATCCRATRSPIISCAWCSPSCRRSTACRPRRSSAAQNFALRAWLDPAKLAAYGLTAADVSTALAQNNYISGLGNTKGQMVQVNLTASTNLHSADEFAQPGDQAGERRHRPAEGRRQCHARRRQLRVAGRLRRQAARSISASRWRRRPTCST